MKQKQEMGSIEIINPDGSSRKVSAVFIPADVARKEREDRIDRLLSGQQLEFSECNVLIDE